MNSLSKQHRTNKIFMIIRDFERMFPEEFRKCDIHKCGHCKGTGLSSKHSLEHCTHCGGIGYRGFETINGDFVCRTCNGYGCNLCDDRGIVDWVAHARSSDTPKGKYI